jgi:hypothetical protein
MNTREVSGTTDQVGVLLDGDSSNPDAGTVSWRFVLSAEEATRLDSLMSELGIVAKKDLINNALSLFVYVCEQLKSGRDLATIDREGLMFREVHMKIFDQIKSDQIKP